jgi:D-cysteine desulfhydrase
MKSPRLPLVHGPTPIVHLPALEALVGTEVWVKRDDATGGAEAGNKLRKLEFLLADARAKGTKVVVTCGALQSNHARATALVAARLGMRAILFLRTEDPSAELPWSGNVLLDRLVEAEIRRITPAQYRERAALMESAAQEVWRGGEQPYVIPEGGSNGLGALGYVDAMRETARQLALGLCGEIRRFDLVAHACGSGGTAAGIALGCARYDVAPAVRAFAVCDDAAYFHKVIERIIVEARAYEPELDASATLVVDDQAKGPRYGQMSAEQLVFLRDVVRATGLVLDPVYTGKALFGLARAVERGDVPRGSRVLFVHTGGLPGLLASFDDPSTAAALA